MLESEADKIEETIEEETKDIDPPEEKCSEELQRKIIKFLEYKKAGKSYNAELRSRKDYQNRHFLLQVIRYLDIDPIGSYFSENVFDPHGYDKSDHYTEIELDMKREMARKDLKRRFVSGGTERGGTAMTTTVSLPQFFPGRSSRITVQLSGLIHADDINRHRRPN